VRQLSREQLLQLQRLLDRLEGHPENQTPEKGPHSEGPVSGQ
jgi:hypothetical protein